MRALDPGQAGAAGGEVLAQLASARAVLRKRAARLDQQCDRLAQGSGHITMSCLTKSIPLFSWRASDPHAWKQQCARHLKALPADDVWSCLY